MGGAGTVDWLPGVAFLVVGVALGVVLVWRFRSRPASPPPSGGPLALRDLAGKRDALFAQLRELEDTAVKRTPAQLATERYALELEAAKTMLELEGLEAATDKAPRRAPDEEMPGTLSDRPALRGFVWGTGTAAALGLLLYFVAQAAQPRGQGGSVTGGITTGTGAAAGQAPSTDPEEAAARDAVARNPDDLEARLALTRIYLRNRNLMGVWNETQYILTKSPGHPQALSYQSIVRMAMGQPEMALEMLKQALRTDPNLLEGYVHLSFVYSRLGRASEAQATIAEAMRRFPEQADALKRVAEEVRTNGGSGTAQKADAEGNPHERVLAPGASEGAGAEIGSPPRAGADGAGAARMVSGTVELDPSLSGQITPGTIVFITLRESGFGAGPPLAAKRLVARSFPIPFEIGSADSMRGDPIPDEALIEARADSDGDPITRSPLDPTARADDVKVGSTNLHLVLKRR